VPLRTRRKGTCTAGEKESTFSNGFSGAGRSDSVGKNERNQRNGEDLLLGGKDGDAADNDDCEHKRGDVDCAMSTR